jgi:hypothetical protein
MNRDSEQALESAPRYPGRVLDARLHLLDRQVLDRDAVPVTTVDDLEIEDPPTLERIRSGSRPPRLTALLAGTVLATRVFGGRPPESRLERIALDRVADIDIVITLTTTADEESITWTERWLRDRVFRHIPGGDHDPE